MVKKKKVKDDSDHVMGTRGEVIAVDLLTMEGETIKGPELLRMLRGELTAAKDGAAIVLDSDTVSDEALAAALEEARGAPVVADLPEVRLPALSAQRVLVAPGKLRNAANARDRYGVEADITLYLKDGSRVGAPRGLAGALLSEYGMEATAFSLAGDLHATRGSDAIGQGHLVLGRLAEGSA